MANNRISRILSESMIKEVSAIAGDVFPGSGRLLEKGLNLAAGRNDMSSKVMQTPEVSLQPMTGTEQNPKNAYRKSNYNQNASYDKNIRNSVRTIVTECDICEKTKGCNETNSATRGTSVKGAHQQVELLRQGIILSEVLGQPVCKIRHRRHA